MQIVYQLSMKKALEHSKFTVSAPYCELPHLFSSYTRNYYNKGIYGWNCDIFYVYIPDFGVCTLTTGYRNTRGETIPHEIAKKYDKAAEDILRYSTESNYEKELAIKELRIKLFKELINLSK